MMSNLLPYQKLRAKGIPYTREHLRRLIEAGKFPAPVVLSETASGRHARIAWVESEVDAWIERLVNQRKRSGDSKIEGGADAAAA